MAYLNRAIDSLLDQFFPSVSAVALDGMKAVGKTETAARRSETILRLDTETGEQLISADPLFSSFPPGTILIDEWQKLPQCWDYVRRAVDDGAAPGRFILTGSATPVSGHDTHSGAGRIISFRMRPMAIFERGKTTPTVSLRKLLEGTAEVAGETDWKLGDYISAIASSGLPEVMKMPAPIRNQHLDSYIQRIVDRDLPLQGYSVRNREGLMAWMAAYAAASSTTASYAEILDAATPGQSQKPAKTTTMLYREKLSEIWILDEVPAWDFRRSPFSGLAKSPKHQLADPALVLRLLGVSEAGLLSQRFQYLLGPLFESLATLSVRVAAEAALARVGHFRLLKGNREVDLIVEGQEGQIIPIEVKLAAHIKDDDVRHLLWMKDKLPDDVVDMIVLTTGDKAYRRSDGVAVIPLALLGA